MAGNGRNAAQLLFAPIFGALFWGKLISTFGVWVHSVVAAIVVFASTRSALSVGLVTALQFAPQLLLTPLSGRMADRGHIWGQMMFGRLLCVAGSGLLCGWFALNKTGADSSSAVVPVYIASLLVGVGFALGGPAQQSVIPLLVRANELTSAMMLNTAPMIFARIAGPAVGAVVYNAYGPTYAFGVAAVTHLIFVIVIGSLRFPKMRHIGEAGDSSVWAALMHVRLDRPLLLLLIAVTAVGVGSEPTITLAPALSASFSGGAQLVSSMSVSFGIGAALGLAFVTGASFRWGHASVTFSGLLLMSTGLLLISVFPWLLFSFGGFSLIGAGFALTLSAATTVIQQRSPAELRGRVMAFWSIGFLGGRPVAASVMGIIADRTNVHVAMFVVFVFLLLVALACRPRELVADPK